MKNDQKKLIGIIGLGYWGPNWLRNTLVHPNFDLAWIVDTNQLTLEKFKNMYGLSQQQVNSNIDKAFEVRIPDLVLISTPPATHFELGRLALNYESNVIIEKPVGLNIEETLELVKLSTSLKLQLFVDHTYIFTPQAKFIYETLKKGLLGDLQFITSSRLNLGLIQKDVDVIRDLAVHDLALFDYFIPNKLNTVSASSTTHLPSVIPSTASINLNYEKNLLDPNYKPAGQDTSPLHAGSEEGLPPINENPKAPPPKERPFPNNQRYLLPFLDRKSFV
jgi:predicted dehydrogenase